MELLANELSIHGQFHDPPAFRDALARLMTMRATACRYGREVHCHRAFLSVEPQAGVSLQQTLGQLAESKRRAVFGWLTRAGPCLHDGNDWFECRGDPVTDTAVGEAAYRTLHGVTAGLLSVTPSNWSFSPVEVTWRDRPDRLEDLSVVLGNWWDPQVLERSLQTAEQQISSWEHLRHVSTTRFERLTFAGNCFEAMSGVPFAKSAAERIRVLLKVLDRFAREFDTDGRRTPEGQRIYQDFFTGKNSRFADSSDTEKRDFRKELTFPHPSHTGKYLFCTWHGKVADYRIHFSWPVRFGEPVYVVYVGWKITRR